MGGLQKGTLINPIPFTVFTTCLVMLIVIVEKLEGSEERQSLEVKLKTNMDLPLHHIQNAYPTQQFLRRMKREEESPQNLNKDQQNGCIDSLTIQEKDKEIDRLKEELAVERRLVKAKSKIVTKLHAELNRKVNMCKSAILEKDAVIEEKESQVVKLKEMHLIPQSVLDVQLEKAVILVDEELVKLFVNLGANVNKKNNNSETPLHLVARWHNTTFSFSINTIKFLIDSGADVYAKNKQNNNFLYKLLLVHGAPSPSRFHDLANFLISKNLSQLFNASGYFHKNNTPFHIAVNRMEIERATLDLLKNNGVNFNAIGGEGWSVLFWATGRNRTLRLISDLVDLGANPNHLNDNKNNLLHTAARNGNVELLKFFLDQGLDVNAQNNHGETPLHYIFANYDGISNENAFKTVQFLLKNGANSSIVDNGGATPSARFDHFRDEYSEADQISTCFSLGSSC